MESTSAQKLCARSFRPWVSMVRYFGPYFVQSIECMSVNFSTKLIQGCKSLSLVLSVIFSSLFWLICHGWHRLPVAQLEVVTGGGQDCPSIVELCKYK